MIHDNDNDNMTINRALNFGSGLLSMGLVPGVHTMVGLYCRWDELLSLDTTLHDLPDVQELPRVGGD